MFDLLDQVESSLTISQVGIQEFAESDHYCNPPEAPLWMADLTFKPIGEVEVGDKVMGWKRSESGIRKLCESEVLDVSYRHAPIVKVTMESGRTFRCTADHKWLTGSQGGGKNNVHGAGTERDGEWYAPAKPGRTLIHVVDPTPALDPELTRTAAWLGGIFDGEGSTGANRPISIAQCPNHNPDVHRAIGDALDALGFQWTTNDRAYLLKPESSTTLRTSGVNARTTQMVVDFVNWCQPVRRRGLQEKCMKSGWRTKDKVVSVEPDGEGEVVALTTSTGNYVANGYASKNCDKPLYPRQLVLLKLIFLEELTGEEEDILDYWIAGGRGGGEITISPNIRERVEYLREHGYKHFREIDLVAGRRASKGFVTGMAMAKVMWDTLQLQDPGRYYGIDPDKDIYFSCVAGSEAQAKEFQFADFSSAVSSCKAFEPYIAKELETEFRVSTPEDLRKIQQRRSRGTKIDKDIAKLRGKALAANAGTLRGSATMALVIDEMAHMIAGESKASAEQVYNAAVPALDQFGRDGIIFCNSSPYSKVGMFYDRYIVAMTEYDKRRAPGEDLGNDKVNGTPLSISIQVPSWAFFEGYKKYKSRWKPSHKFEEVITASPDWDPEELDEDGKPLYSERDKQKMIVQKAKEAANPETFKVENRGKFAEVTDAYLNAEMVDRIFRGKPAGFDAIGRQLLKPFHMDTGEGATNLFRYKFHLDPSSTTAGFGFAIAHTEQFADKDGQAVPHVMFDLVKRWNPKDFPGNTIAWPVIINEILMWADLFRPFEITFDQFQSAEPIQTLKYALMEKGIEGTNVYVKTATLEHNWFRAETFKTAINHALVHAPVDCTTIDPYGPDQELKFLQQKNTSGRYPRVDKQDLGPVQTKDMADCMMECVETLIGNQLQTLMRERAVEAVMAPGAQHGFRIGGQAQPTLSDLHPNLAGYYDMGKRVGEQSLPGYTVNVPSRGSLGGGRRGVNRGIGRRSRGRF